MGAAFTCPYCGCDRSGVKSKPTYTAPIKTAPTAAKTPTVPTDLEHTHEFRSVGKQKVACPSCGHLMSNNCYTCIECGHSRREREVKKSSSHSYRAPAKSSGGDSAGYFTFVGIVLIIIMVCVFPVGGVPIALIAAIRYCQVKGRG